MTAKMSFCLKAATTLGNQDLAAITDAIEAYARGGMDMRQAEAAAVDDVLKALAGERSDLVGLVRDQHADLFDGSKRPPAPAPAPADTGFPALQADLLDTAAPAAAPAASKPTLPPTAPAVDTPAFKRWFGDSKIVNADGSPKVMYHGTAQDVTEFRPQQAESIFLTDDPRFAETFAIASESWMRNNGKAGAPVVMPLYVKAENTFDFRSAAAREKVATAALAKVETYTQGDGQKALVLDGKNTLYTKGVLEEAFKKGDWLLIEDKSIQQVIRDLGYDSYRVQEDGRVNLAVYKPTQVKSATKNSGAFDPANADIRFDFSDSTDTPAFKKWFGASKVVDDAGQPRVVYHGTGAADISKFDLSRIAQHGRSEGPGVYFTTDSEIAQGYGQNGKVISAYLSIEKPLDYKAKAFNPLQMRKFLAETAKIEARENGHDWKDGFLSNYVDTYNLSLDAAVRKAAMSFAGEDQAVDQIGGLIGSGVDAEIVNDALTAALGYDGYRSNGFSGEGNKGGVIWVAMRSTQIKSTDNAGTFDPKNPDIRMDKGNASDFEDTRLPTADVVSEAPVSEESAAAVEQLQQLFSGVKSFKALKLAALPDIAKPADNDSAGLKERFAAVDLFRRVYGKKVVFFSANMPFANGLFDNRVPDTLFANEATKRPVMALLGHELLHSMRNDQPALYDKLVQRLDALMQNPGRYHDLLAARYAEHGIPALSDGKVHEELVADIVGDFHTDPDFWRDMAAGQPALFQRVLGAVREFFNKLLAALKREKPYGTDQYLSDVRAARAAVAEVMGEFAADQRAAAQPADTAWTALSANNDPFFSELGRQIGRAPMNQGTAEAWKQALKGMLGKGVKADEIAWTGIEDWLDLQPGRVTRDQVLDFLKGSGVQVEETMLDKTSPTKYSQYVLPGGTDYRELLLTLPAREQQVEENGLPKGWRIEESERGGTKQWSIVDPSGAAQIDYMPLDVQSMGAAKKYARNWFAGHKSSFAADGDYKSRHWDQPNIVAHVRFNTRTDADGKKVLFIEEIQSDWAQAGKKTGFDGEKATDDERRAAAAKVVNADDALDAAKSLFGLRNSAVTDALNKLERMNQDPRTTAAEDAAQREFIESQAALAQQAKEAVRVAGVALTQAMAEQNKVAAKGKGVPIAPFVGKTDAWVSLALKRMIKYAVDNGFDRVAFVNGDQSAERYDLSQHIDRIDYNKNDDDSYNMSAIKDGREIFSKEDVSASELEDLVGKDVAKKIIDGDGALATGEEKVDRWEPEDASDDEPVPRSLSGLDLKVGGKGMKAFYDQIVPKVAKEVVRKLGGSSLTDVRVDTAPSFDKTSAELMVRINETSGGQYRVGVGSGDQRVAATFPTRAQAESWASEQQDLARSRRVSLQTGFDITDSMREKAAGGLPMFSLPDYTSEQKAALAKAGIDTRTRLQRAGDRIRAFYPRIAAQVQSQWGRQFQQGFVDQFTGIAQAVKNELGGLPVEQDPYVAARLANGGTSSVMRGLLLHGQARWAANRQHLEKIPGTKGLLEILEPLGADVNDFFGWMIGHRAARLMAEGRENNFTAADIAALKALGTGKEDKFRAAALQYAAFKRSVLDIAEQAGLIEGESRKVWDQADYIPFYRQIDEKAVFSATGKKGLAGQSSGIRQLRGGESALNDPMENIIMNFSRLVDASLKNNAILKTVYLLQEAESDVVQKVGYAMSKEMIPADQVRKVLEQAGTLPAIINMIPSEAFDGMAKMWAIQAPTSPDVVRVMHNGKPEFYRVNDPLLLKALTSFVPFDFPGLGLMRAFKRLLTGAVTATPEFMIRNFIRDSVATQMVGKDGINPLASITGIAKSYTEAGGFENMLFAGASFQSGQINAADPVATAKAARRALRKKGFAAAGQDIGGTILDTPAKFWEAYRHVGEAIENANREAVYEATLKAGKTGTAAAFESKDLMDFTLRGSSPIYQVMADVLPFFNARVQGLYRLGRANPKRLATYGMLMLAASVMLVLANGDNPEYDQLPDWDKDTYWHVWIGGKHFRIPKPFELGVIFATLPERFTQYVKGHDSGKKLISRVFANVRDQLAIDPVPQLLRPGLNAAYNHDSFRDRPIETMSDEGKLPSRRFGPYTSATARAAVDALNVHVPGTTTNAMDAIGLSPKKLEYLVGGYLGTTGLYALGLSDMAVKSMEGAPPSPKPRLDDYPVIRSFYRMEPARATQFESDFYELRTHIEQVYKTIMAEAKDGNIEKATALRDQHAKQLAVRDAVTDIGKRLTLINKARDNVYMSREMTPLQKREELDRLQGLKNDLLRRAMKQPAIAAAQ